MNRQTTHVQAAENNTHFLPMTVYLKRYDSRKPGKNYALWTTGKAYVVKVGNRNFASGYFSYDRVYPMYEKDLQEMGIEAYKEWETIPFSEISLRCQKDLAEKMGELFPWDASYWGSKEKFEEYWEPQTFEGKIAKSLREHIYFYKEFYNSNEFLAEKEKSICLKEEGRYREHIIVLKNGDTFKQRSGYSDQDGYWATLEKITDEQTDQLLKELEERKAQEALARKEHARKCGVMARKYGIRFEISLRCFKGNEEDIKNFVESLKKAFGKDFDGHELSECGRARRRTEIERLGIEIGNVDPNHIAEYIYECLHAGVIVK